MQLAMIGLGRMGGNMTERLMRGGHAVVVYDRDPATVKKYQQMGATPATDLAEVVKQLPAPRVFWIMVPAGSRWTTPSMRCGRSSPPATS